MNIQYKIIRGNDLENSHRKTFEKLLGIQGKVKGNLLEKADRCKLVCIVSINDIPIGIGAIKPKTNSDFDEQKADLSRLFDDFNWELGYLFILDQHQGNSIASNMVNLLIQEYGDDNLMASTEINANPGMVRILEKNGFRQYGKPWKSSIHDNYLGLFLKFK